MSAPETAADALAYVLHRQLHQDHDGPGCCSMYVNDEADAADLLDGLSELGWLPPRRVMALPSEVPAGQPETAASEIHGLSDRHWAVWAVLNFGGPMSDEELVDRVQAKRNEPGSSFRHLHPQTPQSIRSRRAELVRAGHVAPLLGDDGKQVRRPTRAGGTGGVWVATGSERRSEVKAA